MFNKTHNSPRKPSIIIIGGSHEQECLVNIVKQRGFTSHVFDYNQNCECSKTADYFYPVSIYEPDQILDMAKGLHPVAVVSVASEQGIRVAAYLSEQFGLPTNGSHIVDITTDKHKMKQILIDHDIPTPKSYLVKDPVEIPLFPLDYPVIIKAADRTGGRGVKLVHSPEECIKTYQESKEYTFGGKVLIEEYFLGKQYSIEMISFAGKHQVVSYTEEFYTGAPYFVECENMMQARLSPEVKKQIEALSIKTLDAFGIQLGASHIELRINEAGEIKVIELASRMGGDLRNEQIRLSTGENYAEMLLDATLGNQPKRLEKPKSGFAMIKYICEPANYETYRQIKEKYPHFIVREAITFEEGNFKAENCPQRRGWYLLQFDDESLCEELLRR